ncbi:BA75_04554T0 [Komagataella pastoris]|uniref:BA75_04554T0 n=1 Tax=Komagataella pastoris TaxID=4922 RepID=A0A1B2JH52_PICPA|nr:BA75_04554T0 [Komagataella pastoris]
MMMSLQPSSKHSIDEHSESNSKRIRIDSSDKTSFSDKMIKSYIKSIIDSLDNEESLDKMDKLIYKLSLPLSHPESLQTDQLTVLFSILSSEIGKIDTRKCHGLIQGLLNVDTKDSELSTTYCKFLCVLVSASPKWVIEIVSKLVSRFVEGNVKLLHDTLKYIISVVPTSTNVIQKQLIKKFPNRNDKKRYLVHYVQNLLYVSEYCPQLSLSCWSLVVENCIKLDVELQNEIEEADDEDLEVMEGTEDGQDNDNDSDSASEDDESDDDEEDADDFDESVALDDGPEAIDVADLSAKLDSIMMILMKTTDSYFNSSDDKPLITFNNLISMFRTHILPTHYTRVVQYLLFHVTQYQSELMDSFLVTLIDVAFQPKETVSKRIKSMQYLASYMARAKNVSKSQIVFIISYLISWIEKYIHEREEEINDGRGMDRFKMFYSVFQSVLYIFCFRYSSLKTDTNTWECNLDKFFQRVIMSKFNPLKFCNDNVVLIFARISQEQDICYCYSIIESNKCERRKGLTGSTASTNSSGSGMSWDLTSKQEFSDLAAYFPFDPLFLRRTAKFISPNYIEWDNHDESDSDY